MSHLRVLDSPYGKPLVKWSDQVRAGADARTRMGESQHSLFLDLNKRNWLVLAKLRRKGGKARHLNCVLGLVWVEFGGHTGREERALHRNGGRLLAAVHLICRLLSGHPWPGSRSAVLPLPLSLIYHYHHHLHFLDANAPDKCSARHDTLPVHIHKRRR